MEAMNRNNRSDLEVQVFLEGYNAYIHAGKFENANPYIVNSTIWRAWRDGNETAQLEEDETTHTSI